MITDVQFTSEIFIADFKLTQLLRLNGVLFRQTIVVLHQFVVLLGQSSCKVCQLNDCATNLTNEVDDVVDSRRQGLGIGNGVAVDDVPWWLVGCSR